MLISFGTTIHHSEAAPDQVLFSTVPKKVPIDPQQVENLASLQCRDEEIASFFGIARETFVRRKAKSPALREAIERGHDKGKVSLRRAQFKAALNGNPAMLIWLGKQMLAQRDNLQLSGPNDGPITIETLDAIVAEAEADDAGEGAA